MKKMLILLLVFNSLSLIAASRYGEDDEDNYEYEKKVNTLTLEFPNKKNRVEKISSIRVDRDGINITGVKGALCRISFAAIEKVSWKVRCAGTEEVDTVSIRQEYKEIFNNASKPIISCTFDSQNKVIGFDITGQTKLNGEPVLLQRGLALEMDAYRRDYPVEEEDDTGTEVLESLGRGLTKLFFAGMGN